MTFAIPTLSDLVVRARRAFRTHLKGSDAYLWPNNVYASAKVLGGLTHEVFGAIDRVAKQKFVLSADWEGLLDHGKDMGIPPRPADAARGTVLVTGEGAFTVASGAVFRRGDGILFQTLESASALGGGTLELPVVAQSNGKATSTEAGTLLEPVSGVAGEVTAEVATGGLIGGLDAEDPESYRERLHFRKSNPPNGGKASDYVIWAKSVPGVTRVFVEKAWAGGSTIRIFVLMDDLYPDGIPPQAEIERVAEYIDTVAPAGAIVTVAAPNRFPIDIVLSGFSPALASVQDEAVAELREAFRRYAKVAGNNAPHPAMPYLATPQTFSRSWLGQAVSNATGEERHGLVQPASDLAVPRGSIPVLNNIRFAED